MWVKPALVVLLLGALLPGRMAVGQDAPKNDPEEEKKKDEEAKAKLADFRKDILIELINEAGQIVIAYKVHRCWPSEYVALPDLDANATDVAFEQLILQNEGWERDTSVAEPQEPSF